MSIIRPSKNYKPPGNAPKEGLAYISPLEARLLKAMTDGRSNMTPAGIPTFYMEGSGSVSNTGVSGSGNSNYGSSYGNAQSAGTSHASAGNYGSTGGVGNQTSSASDRGSGGTGNNSFGGINTSTIHTNDLGSTHDFGPVTGVSPGTSMTMNGMGGRPNIMAALSQAPTSALMQEAMRRQSTQALVNQYTQYRSPPPQKPPASSPYPTSDQFLAGPTGPSYARGSGVLPMNSYSAGPQPVSPVLSREALAKRAKAVSRGPGLSDPTGYQKSITAVSTYPETPSGTLDPAFNQQLNIAALNRQPLFNLAGGTPEQQALINGIAPDALMASGRYGLDARTLVGQALTESSTKRNPTGISGLARNANNLFGLKAAGKPNQFWNGSTLNLPTTEVVNGQTVKVNAPFRSYTDPSQSVYDYARLMGTPRYADALAGKTSVQDQLAAIRGAGYATYDPTAYVNMAMNNVNRLSVGDGTPTGPTQVASATPMAGRPETQVDTSPSWLSQGLQKLKTGAQAGYKAYTDANQKINSVGGPKNAVAMAKLAAAFGIGGFGSSPSRPMQPRPEGAGQGGGMLPANGGQEQAPIQPASSPAQIQSLVTELDTATPARAAQIRQLLAQLDPNTIRYSLQMRAA